MPAMIDPPRSSPGSPPRAPASWAAALGALGALAGCLSVPHGPTPMCEATTDCDVANKEVCAEGVCWGNPPTGMFAAVLSPPSTRHDLVPVELPAFALAGDGWMGELRLARPASLNGRIVAFCPTPMTGCDATTLAGTVTASRRSQFQGGPGFKVIINVEGGAESFALPVPVTSATDDPYTITVVPDATPTVTGSPSPAERVPPKRTQLSVSPGPSMLTLELGGPDLPVISGTLTNALGQGLGGYRVAALGRWDPTEPVTEVSTVDYTDGASGSFAVTLSADLVGTVELVARPRMPEAIAPTVRLANIDATRSSSKHDAVAPANLGGRIDVPFTVSGVDLNGAISHVRGAVVSVSGASTSTLTSFTVLDEQVTDEHGAVMLHLLDGPGLAEKYRMSITPPASSTLSAVFDQKITLPPAPVQLISRIALRGTIEDADGKPLDNVAVTARPSLRFLWTLDAAPQAFVAAIPAATTVTPPNGVFVLWVDANIAQTWGHYDLMIEPPTTTQAPAFIKTDAEIPRDVLLDAFDVGIINVPSAAFVHGQISDLDGHPVEGAELKLYMVDTQLNLCSEVAHAPSSCPIPAHLQGRNTSDAKGAVRLVLPR